MKLLLTGATGFIGRNLLLRFIKEGTYREILVPVRSREKLVAQFLGDGFDSLPSTVIPIVTSAHQWNFSDYDLDHVIHTAGLLSARNPKEYLETNVDGTRLLFSSLKGDPKIVVLSSLAASGPCEEGCLQKDERSTDSPVTWYGESKLAMEKLLREYFLRSNYLILRPPMVLGARDQMTLPLFKVVRTPFFPKPGLRPKFYSYISVTDLVEAICVALRHPADFRLLPQREFFVAADGVVSDTDLLTTAAQVSGRRGIILKVPHSIVKGLAWVVDSLPPLRASVPTLTKDKAKEIFPDRWVVSSQAFCQHFPWKSVQSFESVMRETNDWYVRRGQLQA